MNWKPPIQTSAPARSAFRKHAPTRLPPTCVPIPTSPYPLIKSVPSPPPIIPTGPFQIPFRSFPPATSLSAATSVPCGARAPRKAPQSPSRNWMTREGTCSSTSAPPSSRSSNRNLCWRSHARVWISTTARLPSAATATRPAISPRSISTAWSCSASSSKPTCKPPWSTCAPPRSSLRCFSTIAPRSKSWTSPGRSTLQRSSTL